MALRLIDRFHPRLRREWQEEIDAGRLRKVESVELLGTEQLQPLARLSLYMLLIGVVFFGVLNLAAYFWQRHTLSFSLSFGEILLWLVINIVAYIVILPLHELVHGLVIALLGGQTLFRGKAATRAFLWREKPAIPSQPVSYGGAGPIGGYLIGGAYSDAARSRRGLICVLRDGWQFFRCGR